MKRLLLYILLIPLYSYGQTEVYNTDLFDMTKHQLFQYDRNDLLIKSPYRIDKIEFAETKLDFTILNDGKFRVYPKRRGAGRLRLYSKGKVVYVANFHSDTLSIPVARVGYSLDTVLSLNQVLLNPYLAVLFPGTNYRGQYSVFQFTMTIELLTGDVSPNEGGDGNRFSERQLSGIKQLHSGDKLHFPYVTGFGPDSRMQKFPPFTIIIK